MYTRQYTENSNGDGSNLQEKRFFVALMLPAEIAAKVTEVIQFLSEHYNTRVSTAAPHITLIPPFHATASQLEHLKIDLREFSAFHVPIQVHLQGFGAFPKRVLYVDLSSPGEIVSFKGSLDESLPRSRHFLPVPCLEFVPHVSVASKRVQRRGVFDAAWAEIQSKTFEGSWTAMELTLLCFDNNNRWVEVEKFSLGEKEQVTDQHAPSEAMQPSHP
jgi:2'-5' RNA ligase